MHELLNFKFKRKKRGTWSTCFSGKKGTWKRRQGISCGEAEKIARSGEECNP